MALQNSRLQTYNSGQQQAPAQTAQQRSLQTQLGGGTPAPVIGDANPPAAPGGAQTLPVGPGAELPGAATTAPSPSVPGVPNAPPAAPGAVTGATGGDPFTAMGGGVQTGTGDWVPNSNPASGSKQTVQGSFQTALMGLINGPSPQDAGKDVMSSPAMTGYQLASQKQEERDRALMAERNAAGGLSNSGAMETGIMGLRQNANEGMARFAGEQAQQSEQGRRQELLTALTLAQQMGDTESARALQMQIAQMGNTQYYDRMGVDIADQTWMKNYLSGNAMLPGA